MCRGEQRVTHVTSPPQGLRGAAHMVSAWRRRGRGLVGRSSGDARSVPSVDQMYAQRGNGQCDDRDCAHQEEHAEPPSERLWCAVGACSARSGGGSARVAHLRVVEDWVDPQPRCQLIACVTEGDEVEGRREVAGTGGQAPRA